MHLVDAHWPAPGAGPLPRRHVRLVVPGEITGPGDNRGRRGPHLAAETHRVRFQRLYLAVGTDDLIFVIGALAGARREQLPQAAVDALAHLMQTPVPLVEIAHHRDAGGLRRPNREQHAVHAFMGDEMSADPAVELAVGAFHDEIVVHRPQHRAEAIGVREFPGSAKVRGAQAVGEAAGLAGKEALEEIPIAPFKLKAGLAVLQHLQALRARHEGADNRPALDKVQTKHREWIAMPCGSDPGHVLVSRAPVNPGHAFPFTRLGAETHTIQLAPALSRSCESNS